MTTRTSRTRALREAIVLAVVLAALGAAFVTVQQRPAGADELRIPIQTLRSQFDELTLMNEQAGDAQTPRFVMAHATQLAKAVDEARDELQSLDPQPGLRSVREEALVHARRLLDDVEAMRRTGRALPPASQADLQARARALQAREEGLRR